MQEIDTIDKRILNVLSRNSKLSVRDIGQKVGVSSVTVLNRVKKLEAEGIIGEYTVRFSTEKMGYDFEAIVEIKALGISEQVIGRVKHHPNVTQMIETSGEYNLMIICKFDSRAKIKDFISEIQRYDTVQAVKSKMIMNTIKDSNVEL